MIDYLFFSTDTDKKQWCAILLGILVKKILVHTIQCLAHLMTKETFYSNSMAKPVSL